MASSSSAERYRLRDAFCAARDRVLNCVPSHTLARSVAYWALSADRRLPVALLDRPVREILETPFERLAATPGIGLKKIAMLITLLRRAADNAGAVDSWAAYDEPNFEDGSATGTTSVPLVTQPDAITLPAPASPATVASPNGLPSLTATPSITAALGNQPTAAAATSTPTIVSPTTVSPTTVAPTTAALTIASPTTSVPTTSVPTTSVPTMAAPITTALTMASLRTPTAVAPTMAPKSMLAATRTAATTTNASGTEVDPDYVSETLWARWRMTVRQNELEQECLGRFAPSLDGVPTVIWHAPLGDYTPLSLAELRKRKTHGEKRVRVILQVFRGLYEAFGENTAQGRLALRPLPRFILPVESWLRMAARSATPVGWAEVRTGLALPLINQVAVDAGPHIAKLVESRLGVEGVAETVVEQSRRLGLTRARVYQLLETCAAIMAVRWPEGRLQFATLAANSRRVFIDPESRRLFEACCGLCFPQEMERRPGGYRDSRRGGGFRYSVDRSSDRSSERSSDSTSDHSSGRSASQEPLSSPSADTATETHSVVSGTGTGTGDADVTR
ncbi:MAG: hypothetical protein RLY70_2173 [Planctomycetota bacterium]